jgi:hypothetical protein
MSQAELKKVKSKEEVKKELKKLLIEIAKNLPLEGDLRDILMDRRDDLRVYIEGWKAVVDMKVEDVIISEYKDIVFEIDVDVDIENPTIYTFLLKCDIVSAHNEENFKTATLQIKNMKMKEVKETDEAKEN